jgi:hypothetical protein
MGLPWLGIPTRPVFEFPSPLLMRPRVIGQWPADSPRAAWPWSGSCRSTQPRCPDLVEEIIDTRKREAQRGFIDEAPVAYLLMHAADHDLGPVYKACWDRYERLVHLLLRPNTTGEGGRGRHRQYRLAA